MAIRQATERLVRRMPTLTSLCFGDGRPFVDSETYDWLSGATGDEGSAAQIPEYASLREELIAQLDKEGVEVVLSRLQEWQATFHAPRQRCYATIIAADLLAARGLSWLAEDLYTNVGRIMQATPADQWEPDLYGHLAKPLPSPGSLEQGSKGLGVS